MIGDITVRSPSHFQEVPGARASIAPTVFLLVLRPITDSENNIGSESRKQQRMYIRMNAAPPFYPTMKGNLQMLPRPMAEPAIAMITAALLPKRSLPPITL